MNLTLIRWFRSRLKADAHIPVRPALHRIEQAIHPLDPTQERLIPGNDICWHEDNWCTGQCGEPAHSWRYASHCDRCYTTWALWFGTHPKGRHHAAPMQTYGENTIRADVEHAPAVCGRDLGNGQACIRIAGHAPRCQPSNVIRLRRFERQP